MSVGDIARRCHPVHMSTDDTETGMPTDLFLVRHGESEGNVNPGIYTFKVIEFSSCPRAKLLTTLSSMHAARPGD